MIFLPKYKPKFLPLITLGLLISGLIGGASIAKADDSVSQYVNLSSEFTTQISILEENPDYDETAAIDYACERRYKIFEHTLVATNTEYYDYWKAIHATAVVLDYDYDGGTHDPNPATNDFLSNVDTSTMYCTLGDGIYNDCGFDKDTQLGEIIASGPEWNGTTVTYQELDFLPGNPVGLLWEYSADDQGNIYEVPWLHGRDHMYEDYNSLNETIAFELEEYDEEYTATTTNYSLTENMYIDPDDDYGNLNNWHHLYSASAEPNGNGADPDGDYVYWYGMNGISRSVFADCVDACESLEITSPTELIAEDVDGITTIEIYSTSDEGEEWEGNYEYTSDGTCEFATSYAYALLGWGNPALSTTYTTVYMHSCTAGDTISITETDYAEACNASLEIGDACEELEVIDPIYITAEDIADGNVQIEIEASAASGDIWEGEYTFTAYDINGDLSSGRFHSVYAVGAAGGGTNPYTTTNEIVDYFDGAPGDSIEIEETEYPNACYADIASENPYCADLTVTPTTVTYLEAATLVELNISAQNQIGATWDTTYTITGDNTCKFTENEADVATDSGFSTLISWADTIYMYNCSPGETITITDEDYPGNCAAIIEVTEEELVCRNMSVVPESITYAESLGILELNYNTFDQNGDDFEGIYEVYSETDTCKFAETYVQAANDHGQTSLISTTNTTIFVYDCTPGETIHIEEIDAPLDCFVEIPVEEEPLYCVDLVLNYDGAMLSYEDSQQVTALNYSVYDQNQADWSGEYTLYSENETCVFAENSRVAASGGGFTTLTTYETTIYVHSCESGDVIHIEETSYPDACSATLEVANEDLACASMEATPTSLTYEEVQAIAEINFDTYDQNGAAWESLYEIYSQNGTCLYTETYDDAAAGLGQDSLDSISTTTIYVYGCEAGDVVRVEEIYNAYDCYVEIPVGEEDLYCAVFNAEPDSFTYDESLEIQEVTFEVVDQNNNEWLGSYEIWSSGEACLFSPTQGEAEAGTGTTTLLLEVLSLGENFFYVYNCAPGDIIYIQDNSYPDNCNDEIPIGTEDLYCAVLTAEPTSFTYDETLEIQEISFTAANQNNENWYGTYDIWSTGEACLFTKTLEEAEGGSGEISLEFIGNSTGENSFYVYNCEGGDTIYIIEQDYPDTCVAEITTETEILYCAVLTAEPTSFTYDETLEIQEISFTAANQSNENWYGTYDIWSTGEACLFTKTLEEAEAGSGEISLEFIGNSTGENSFYVYNCEGGDTIYIIEQDYPDTCVAEITTETEPCVSLVMDPTTTTETDVTFSITSDPTDWAGPWTWTTTNPDGIFTTSTDSGNSITTTATQVDYSGIAGDVVSVYEATDYADVCYATAYLEGVPYCGDGIMDEGEECDDGNNENGDGCSATCQLDVAPYCGDGEIQEGEECDDGNNVGGDGCSSDCKTESGGGGGGTTPTPGGGSSFYCYELRFSDPDVDTFSGTDADHCNSYDDYYCSQGDTFTYAEGDKSLDDEITFAIEAIADNNAAWEGVGENYDYDFEWDYTGLELTADPVREEDSNEILATFLVTDEDGNFDLNVKVDLSNYCNATFVQEGEEPPEPEPAEHDDDLEKTAFTYNFGWYNAEDGQLTESDRTTSSSGYGFVPTETYAHDFDYVFYTLSYYISNNQTAYEEGDEIVINDSISSDDGVEGIGGVIADEYLTDDLGWAAGDITFYEPQTGDPAVVTNWTDNQAFKVYYSDVGTIIAECDGIITDTCYEGSIETELTLKNLHNALQHGDILIQYIGRVSNGEFDCAAMAADDNVSCPVQYLENTATAVNGEETHTASADITITCPYLLTQNAGDVYIEGDLETFDISCYQDYKSSDAVVMSKDSSFLSRISSYLLDEAEEIISDLSSVWSRIKTVDNERIANFESISQGQTLENVLLVENDEIVIESFNDLENISDSYLTNPSQNVYHFSGVDVVFDLDSGVPSGAYTFIIENADLRIRDDITYDDSTHTFTDLEAIPSIAFIVLGGDVYVENDPAYVTDMVGVYYIQEIDGVGGNMDGDWTDPFTTLTIYGSVYGNINSLLGQRTFAGPANYSHGNVVLRYDERIFLNTPPGLEQYIDVSSERTVH